MVTSADAGTRTVVLLGGGYVTLHAYRQLRRRLGGELRRGAVRLIVISADDAHSFHGFTGEVLAGLMPVARTRTPLASILRSAQVIHAVAVAVDRERRTVTYRRVGAGSAAEVRYDQLVVGTGGREPVATVPGLAEFGHTLRGPGDIERLAAGVRRIAAGGSGEQVVVAGGGLAGVEMAAAIADRCGARVGVHLVHPDEQTLPALRSRQPRLARRADQELLRLGVRPRPGTRLVRVEAGGAVLSDGTVLPAAVVLGAIGQRPAALAGLGADLRDATGRLITAADLSVTDGIWAAGDAARVRNVGTGEPVPANALWAIKAGAHLGANVARALRGRPTRPFRYRGLGQAASFGLGRSIAELYGVPLTGVVAWMLRLGFFLRFLPARRRAPAVLADMARAVAARRTPVSGRLPVSARDGAGIARTRRPATPRTSG
jgi:NADH dehydrogenase